MYKINNNFKTIILSLIFFLIFQNKSYAYLDPGTGSILLQAIVAGIVGLLTWVSFARQKIKDILTRLKNKYLKINKK
jgi:O-antigen/teichoic acid export membrane protein|tara:strand:- start:168 stop:398 length:231 start_codon:yes stop_codon:yes gene_type:complete